jgi:hypothetical protein
LWDDPGVIAKGSADRPGRDRSHTWIADPAPVWWCGIALPRPQHTEDHMTRLVSIIQDALRHVGHREPAVHFHAAGGRPEVCHDAGCDRPRLSVR